MVSSFNAAVPTSEKNRDRSQADEQRKFSADRASGLAACFSPAELHPLLQTCAGAYRLGVSRAIKRCNLSERIEQDRPCKITAVIYPPAIAPMIRNGSVPFAIASGSGASGDS